MHHPEENFPWLAVFLLEISLNDLTQWRITCFISLHNITCTLIYGDDVIVFVDDGDVFDVGGHNGVFSLNR